MNCTIEFEGEDTALYKLQNRKQTRRCAGEAPSMLEATEPYCDLECLCLCVDVLAHHEGLVFLVSFSFFSVLF